MTDLTGRTINSRYEVINFLGRGGMAEVYKVWDSQRSTYLAMKVLRDDLAEDSIFIRRFKREAQTMVKLQHPNIVRTYGLEQTGRLAYLLMDYIDGSTLRTEIFDRKGQPLSPRRVMEVMQAVCPALGYAHKKGLVHCDVKPANIMIQKNGAALVADFGIARQAEGATTATMVGIGTPAYMAPEQVNGYDPSPQTDIYALGLMLYEMITGGERPFTGEHAQITGSASDKVRWEQVHLPPPSMRTYNPRIAPELEQVVMKCLKKRPTSRFGTTLDLLNALEGALGVMPEPIQPLPPEPVPRPTPIPPQSVPIPPPIPPRPISPQPIPPPSEPRRFWKDWRVWAGVAAVVLVFVFATRGGTPEPVTSARSPAGQEPAVTVLVVTRNVEKKVVLPIAEEPTETEVPPPTKAPPPTRAPTETSPPMNSDTPPACSRAGAEWTSPIDNMTLVCVSDGGFWIDKTEVTNRMFQKFVNETGHVTEAEETGMALVCPIHGTCDNIAGANWRQPFGAGGGFEISGRGNHPVVQVSWNDAVAYCDWAGRRLPTDDEWTLAAGGTKHYAYPWGNAWEPGYCNNKDTPIDGSVEVGYFPQGASPYGAMDMAGNVWEWNDAWSDGKRVTRGGAWNGGKNDLRIDNIGVSTPNAMNNKRGFRCAWGR